MAAHIPADLVTEKTAGWANKLKACGASFLSICFADSSGAFSPNRDRVRSPTRGPQTGSPAGVGGQGVPTCRIAYARLLTPTEALLAPRVPSIAEELPLRRSLISQIIKQLSTAGKLKAIRPLANREGWSHNGDVDWRTARAGKTPAEFRKVG